MTIPALFDALDIQIKVGADNPELAHVAVRKMESIVEELRSQLNAENQEFVSEFNEVASALKKQYERNSLLKLSLDEANTNIRQLEKTNQSIKKKLSAANSDKAELQRLKSLKPDQLKSKNAELKKEVSQLRSKGKEALKMAKERELDKEIMVVQTEMIARLKKKLVKVEGQGEGETIVGPTGTQFRVYSYEYGLDFDVEPAHVAIVKGLDWHYVVRSDRGIYLKTPCSEWATPVIPECAELQSHWVPEIERQLHEHFLERLKDGHGKLVERVQWAKTRKLDTLPFSEDDKVRLLDSGLTNMFALVTTKPEKLLAQCDTSDKAFIDRVMKVARKALSMWEAAYSDRQQHSEAS